MINHLSSLLAVSLLCSAAGAASSPAIAADGRHTLRSDLVGSWELVDMHADTWYGDDRNPFGTPPQGRMVLDQTGHAMVVILGGDRIPFRSADRLTGSPEENQAAIQGSQAFYGTYTVSESDHTLAFHIEHSSFPNWDGSAQESTIKIDGDELIQTKPGPHSSYGVARWKRARDVELARQQ
jgi:Lipocalin-like domain